MNVAEARVLDAMRAPDIRDQVLAIVETVIIRCGKKRLRRLSESRLICQKEGTVAALDLLDESRLVAHDLALRASMTAPEGA